MLWCGAVAGQRDAIGFAEKVLELLDEGRYTATYKYAVLLALIDLCLEGTQASGAPPEMVTTRQLADKIVELYWPHTVPFASRAPARLPRGHELRPPAVTGRGSSIWSTKPASTIAWCASWSASAGACSYSSSVRWKRFGSLWPAASAHRGVLETRRDRTRAIIARRVRGTHYPSVRLPVNLVRRIAGSLS